MDLLQDLKTFAWYKPEWCFPSMSTEATEHLCQYRDLPELVPCDDIEVVVRRSNEFPIPFPIDTVRLEKLKLQRPIERLQRNIKSTYPLIHERVLLLMANFLNYKKKFGSSIEKALYNDMSVPDLIERILNKRAVMFMTKYDKYKLLSRDEGTNGWEAVGTPQQRPPLVLEDCLSYDEMKISALMYVSGHTECINDGNRKNMGVPVSEGIEEEAVIIGMIGARFKRANRMDYEDIVITKQQNCLDNGYGEDGEGTASCLDALKNFTRKNVIAKKMWRQLWAEFYQVPSYTYEELTSYVSIEHKPPQRSYTERFVKLAAGEAVLDNEVYYKRVSVLAECALLEAQRRALQAGRDAFLNVVGCGLGVWMISAHQVDIYVLTFLDRIRAFLDKDLLNQVTDVNFAYIKPSADILAMFTTSSKSQKKKNIKGDVMKLFLASNGHPKGGVNVQLENREPATRLRGEHEGKLLVITYPWDGNAHPGNEFWSGRLKSSGDSAAACSTQVAEMHNAHINPALVAARAHVVARHAVMPVREYCRLMLTESMEMGVEPTKTTVA